MQIIVKVAVQNYVRATCQLSKVLYKELSYYIIHQKIGLILVKTYKNLVYIKYFTLIIYMNYNIDINYNYLFT